MESSLFISKGEWKTDLHVEEFAGCGINLEIKVGTDWAELMTGHIDGKNQYVVRDSSGNVARLGELLPVKSYVMKELAQAIDHIITEQGGDADTLYQLAVGARGVEGLKDHAEKVALHMNLQTMDYSSGLFGDIFFTDYSWENDLWFICWHLESPHLNAKFLSEFHRFVNNLLDDIENDDEILDYLN